MASFAGLRGTGSWGTDERPKSFREGILFYDPNGVAPIFAMTSMMDTDSVSDPEFSWWEEKLQPIRLQINAGGYDSSTTTFTVRGAGLGTLGSAQLGGLSVKAGDLLMLEVAEVTTFANEICRVTSVTNDTTIVVTREFGSTTGISPANASYLTLIGSAYEEGTAAATMTTRNPTKIYNYTEIFKTTAGATGTAESTEARTGDAFKVDKKRKAFDHSAAIEQAILWGQRSETAGSSHNVRSMAGLRAMISTNVTIFATSPTETTLANALSPVFDYSGEGAGNQRIIYAGNGFLNNFNRLIMNSSGVRINYDKVGKEVYGQSFNRFVIPQGEFLIKSHPLMSRHARFTNSAFILNPRAIKYRPLRGRDTKFEDNIQTPGKDSHEGQWITEASIELHGEFTCAYIANFTL